MEEKDIVYASLDESAATSVASVSNVAGPLPPSSEDDGISLEDHEFVDIDLEMGGTSHDPYVVHPNEDSERTDRTIDMYGSADDPHYSPHPNDSGRHQSHDADEEAEAGTMGEPQPQDSNSEKCVTTITEQKKDECSIKNNIDYEVEDVEAGGENTVCCLKVPITKNSMDTISIEEGDADDTNNDGDGDENDVITSNNDNRTSQTAKKDRNKAHRCVDICCSICLGEYEVGDHVVFSSQKECQHVFHEECIIQWLCKGKKRCPICRHWFVPGISIAEQKAQAEAVALVQQAIDNEQQQGQQQASAHAATGTSTDDSGDGPDDDEIQYDVDDEEEGGGGGTASAATTQNTTEEAQSAIDTIVDVTSVIETQV